MLKFTKTSRKPLKVPRIPQRTEKPTKNLQIFKFFINASEIKS